MADLSRSNVRFIKSWVEGEVTGKRRVGHRVEIHGATVGGTTNTIPASAFNLSVIEECQPAYHSSGGGAIVPVPSPDGAVIWTFKAVDGTTGPADTVLGSTPNGLYFTVKGY